MQNSQDSIKMLQQSIAKQDLPQIFKTSLSLMKQNPQDLEYKQCYTIAAIKLQQFSQLGSGLFKEKPQDKGLQKIYFYYLYSSGQFQKCIEFVKGSKDQSLNLLLAQCYFKTLDYEKSMQIMYSLLKTGKLTHEDKQLYMVNFLASSIPNKLTKVQQFQFLINSNSCKQMLYNFALYLCSIGDLQKSVKFLQLFQGFLQKQDEIDRITAKIFKDFIIFTSKKASELNKQKKIQEYKLLSKSIKDENLLCVIYNNLLYLSSNHDAMGDNYKHLQQLNNSKAKISLFQSVTLRINKLSYLNRKNRLHESTKIMNELEKDQNVKKNTQFCINQYFVFKKTKQHQQTLKYIKHIMSYNVNLGFCFLADFCQEIGDTNLIINQLKFLTKTNNEVAKNYIFSLLIRDSALFSQYNSYLDDLIKSSTELKILQILLKLYETKQDKVKKMLVYQRILQLNPKNPSARVGLAEVYLANNQISKAQELLKGIQLPSEINDLSYLQYIQKNIHVSKKQQQTNISEQDKKLPQKKRIKKKKNVRLPKNVEKPTPGFKPDLEKWLPKWQRKGYKKKGKKGGNKTQGLSTVGMEQKNIYNAGNSTSSKQVTKQSKRRR